MKIPATFFCALFLVGTVFADPYVISKQQAHRAADPNAAPPGGQSQSLPPAATPMDPALAATLQNIGNLRADVAAFNAATTAEPDATEKISLLNHLSAAAQATRPAAADIKKLADHLIAATLGKKIPAEQQTKLARDIHALFNSSHLTAAQQKIMLDDVQKILTDAGNAPDAAGNVVADLTAVAAETK